MYISEILQGRRKSFSFEFFPPKQPEEEAALFQTIRELSPLHPSFVSVTYGAGGSTRDKTMDIVCRIKHDTALEAMAHLTCVGASREDIHGVLDEMRDRGIENVLGLRGDPPRGAGGFVKPEGGFAYAHELIAHIKEHYHFCIGAACFPEGHPESSSLALEMQYLKQKVDAGTSFLITQMFYRNEHYFRLLDRAREVGIDVPIIPGIMPITNYRTIKRITELCGAEIPGALLGKLESAADDREHVRQIGLDYAIVQCQELLNQGAPGLHFYTLNKSKATREIYQSLTLHPPC